MDANTVNDVQLIRAGFSPSAATTSNAGAKWGLRFVGRNDSNYDNQKSGAIYAVSEDAGAGYNRNVGLAFHTSGFDSNHTERVRITSTGKVGIGTTSPSYPLHVVGTDSNHQIRVERTGTGNVNLGVDTTGAFVEAQSSIPLRFYQQAAERMRITSGKILINATSSTPADQLYVNGDAYVTGGWRTGTAATFVGEFTNVSGKLTIQTAANRDIQLGDTANPDILYVDTSTQKVGVGTATPAQALDVVGVGKFRGTSDGSAVLLLGQRDNSATGALYTVYCDDAGSARPLAGDLLEFNTARWAQTQDLGEP